MARIGTKKLLVYTAGPYSGKDGNEINANILKARESAIKLWEYGFAVICPHQNTARFEIDCHIPYEDYIIGDLRILEQCDALFMIEGWEQSEGAKKEHDHAISLEIPVFTDIHKIFMWSEHKRTGAHEDGTVLDVAKKLVFGDRGQDYGHPSKDFTRTAALWTAAISGEFVFQPEHVALFMVLLKVSREMNGHKRDNLVDIAGYAQTCEMVVNPQEGQGG